MSGFFHRLKTAMAELGMDRGLAADPTALGAAETQLPAHLLSALSQALADRYRIERHLGEGGMATVYLAGDQTMPLAGNRSRASTRATATPAVSTSDARSSERLDNTPGMFTS